MHSAVYRPTHPMQQHVPMLYPTRNAYAAPPSLEDTDNIDDILRNLWPTSGPAGSCQSMLYPTVPGMQDGCHGYLRSWAPTLPSIASGQSTPPEESYIAAYNKQQKSFAYASFGQTPPTADATPSYMLATSGASPAVPNFDTMHKQQAAPLGRSVSASIQIGDPEWRVDSPQSVRASTAPHLTVDCSDSTKLPSPVSPTALGSLDSLAMSQDSLLKNRSNRPQGSLRQPTTLGLGTETNSRALPSLRRATLGLLRNDKTGHRSTAGVAATDSRHMSRVLTPEERVARLHSVSGLAARAVARRCLSGQIPVPDADAMLRQTNSHLSGNPSSPFAAGRKKPTFADVARGSQDLF
ncbi:hypothetical protein COEREDRAFT_85517 [Coemansia reversa NRRL 1564]|uniref:Uncharacterized protein n=1 Tax=Coemansia reversa (strain ATCC 12441 / NRRL 1564) TaxID=763665 RepID=A0A2G5BGC1_COERN|nr:hypothetical protein COEREDRAFT_85517 [Coemansia reversa NRRL 1564]|eukprot:PIA18051.1 hypothetical protein COEREDRAFT_85517 [Coemansia reversa NRRL 1564]